jgi:hypothetical protein
MSVDLELCAVNKGGAERTHSTTWRSGGGALKSEILKVVTHRTLSGLQAAPPGRVEIGSVTGLLR